MTRLITILKEGKLDEFIQIVESEALSLHAMMMASKPYYVLMQPNTLEVIKRIWAFRNKTGTPVCFTLDAGANVHVLYPESVKNSVDQFIKSELLVFCEKNQYICDKAGVGAIQK